MSKINQKIISLTVSYKKSAVCSDCPSDDDVRTVFSKVTDIFESVSNIADLIRILEAKKSALESSKKELSEADKLRKSGVVLLMQQARAYKAPSSSSKPTKYKNSKRTKYKKASSIDMDKLIQFGVDLSVMINRVKGAPPREVREPVLLGDLSQDDIREVKESPLFRDVLTLFQTCLKLELNPKKSIKSVVDALKNISENLFRSLRLEDRYQMKGEEWPSSIVQFVNVAPAAVMTFLLGDSSPSREGDFNKRFKIVTDMLAAVLPNGKKNSNISGPLCELAISVSGPLCELAISVIQHMSKLKLDDVQQETLEKLVNRTQIKVPASNYSFPRFSSITQTLASGLNPLQVMLQSPCNPPYDESLQSGLPVYYNDERYPHPGAAYCCFLVEAHECETPLVLPEKSNAAFEMSEALRQVASRSKKIQNKTFQVLLRQVEINNALSSKMKFAFSRVIQSVINADSAIDIKTERLTLLHSALETCTQHPDQREDVAAWLERYVVKGQDQEVDLHDMCETFPFQTSTSSDEGASSCASPEPREPLELVGWVPTSTPQRPTSKSEHLQRTFDHVALELAVSDIESDEEPSFQEGSSHESFECTISSRASAYSASSSQGVELDGSSTTSSVVDLNEVKIEFGEDLFDASSSDPESIDSLELKNPISPVVDSADLSLPPSPADSGVSKSPVEVVAVEKRPAIPEMKSLEHSLAVVDPEPIRSAVITHGVRMALLEQSSTLNRVCPGALQSLLNALKTSDTVEKPYLEESLAEIDAQNVAYPTRPDIPENAFVASVMSDGDPDQIQALYAPSKKHKSKAATTEPTSEFILELAEMDVDALTQSVHAVDIRMTALKEEEAKLRKSCRALDTLQVQVSRLISNLRRMDPELPLLGLQRISDYLTTYSGDRKARQADMHRQAVGLKQKLPFLRKLLDHRVKRALKTEHRAKMMARYQQGEISLDDFRRVFKGKVPTTIQNCFPELSLHTSVSRFLLQHAVIPQTNPKRRAAVFSSTGFRHEQREKATLSTRNTLNLCKELLKSKALLQNLTKTQSTLSVVCGLFPEMKGVFLSLLTPKVQKGLGIGPKLADRIQGLVSPLRG